MMNENKLTLAKIKIKIPEREWKHAICNKYPDIEIDILSILPFHLEKSIGNATFEILHHKIEQIIEDIKAHPSVFEFSILEKEKNRVKINVQTKDPFLMVCAIMCGVLIEFPIRVVEGFAVWNLISTRKRIDDLMVLFEERGVDFSLLQIGNSPYSFDDNKIKLNLNEVKVLEEAINSGFFEIPRRITVADLADQLGKSQSALSVTLRKIIRKKVLFES